MIAKFSYACSSLAVLLFGVCCYFIFLSGGEWDSLMGGAFFLASGLAAVTPVAISWFLPPSESEFPFWTIHGVFFIWVVLTLIVWVVRA